MCIRDSSIITWKNAIKLKKTTLLIGLKQFTVDSYERLLPCKYFSKEEVLQTVLFVWANPFPCKYFSKEQVPQSDFTNNIMRKILFCISKETVLPCKTASFTVQKNGFCNVLIDNRLCDR